MSVTAELAAYVDAMNNEGNEEMLTAERMNQLMVAVTVGRKNIETKNNEEVEFSKSIQSDVRKVINDGKELWIPPE